MPQYREGQTATNPNTGQKIRYEGGFWVAVPSTGSGAAPDAPKMTEGQAKDGFNAKRLQGSSQIINQLEGAGYDASLNSITPGFLPGADEKRKYEAAQLEWADSLIRLTTGAAATKDEVEGAAKTYFPALGDSAAVRKQKADMRARVMRDALTRSGPGAYSPETGATPPAGKPGGPPNPRMAPRRNAGAPKIGEVRKGYRYKGGDPSKPSSWMKQ